VDERQGEEDGLTLWLRVAPLNTVPVADVVGSRRAGVSPLLNTTTHPSTGGALISHSSNNQYSVTHQLGSIQGTLKVYWIIART